MLSHTVCNICKLSEACPCFYSLVVDLLAPAPVIAESAEHRTDFQYATAWCSAQERTSASVEPWNATCCRNAFRGIEAGLVRQAGRKTKQYQQSEHFKGGYEAGEHSSKCVDPQTATCKGHRRNDVASGSCCCMYGVAKTRAHSTRIKVAGWAT